MTTLCRTPPCASGEKSHPIKSEWRQLLLERPVTSSKQTIELAKNWTPPMRCGPHVSMAPSLKSRDLETIKKPQAPIYFGIIKK